MSAPSTPQSVFLVGIGYIGGTLLTNLLQAKDATGQPKYSFTALSRRDEQIAALEKLGVRGVKGELASLQTIRDETEKADIVINTADCDDLPSTDAILEGIKSRPDKSKHIIYIHTSGTGTLADGIDGASPSDRVYSDVIPGDVETLPVSQPHRHVDIAIQKLVESSSFASLNARIAIVVPPLIHGLGTGPFNKLTIQVPTLIRTAIKNGQAIVVGEGKNIWNTVHVRDLAVVYEIALKQLVENTEGAGTKGDDQGLYWFAETDQITFAELGEHVGQELWKAGKLERPTGAGSTGGWFEVGAKDKLKALGWIDPVIYQFGGNSRSSAGRARRLGWKGKEATGQKTEDVLESLRIEVQEVLKNL